MSDIVKRVSFIEAETQDGPIPDDAPVLRRTGDPLVPKVPLKPKSAPEPAAASPAAAKPPVTTEAPPMPLRPVRPHPAPEPRSRRLLWIGLGLGLLTAIAIGLLLYAFVVAPSGAGLGTWQAAALLCAAIVPALSVIALAATLQSLSDTRAQTAHLARLVDRLMQPDSALAEDVSALGTVVRSEIEAVDARLAETRTRFDGFGAALSQQQRDLDATTKTMAERSETIGSALTLHRQAFDSLAQTFDARLESLSAQIDQKRAQLGDTTSAAQTDLDAARISIEDAGKALAEAVSAAAGSSRAADASLDAARDRLESMLGRVQQSAAELDAVYQRRADHLASLNDRFSGERDSTEAVLRQQTERLGAVDAQLEITEGRLTALVDHAQRIHEGLMGQLSAIDTTLENADERSRRFTESLSGRVADAVADARRDLSLMESDLRALQSRIGEVDSPELNLPEPPAQARTLPGRVHLKPLDTDFPPVEPPANVPLKRTPLPSTTDAADVVTADDTPLDLVDFAEDMVIPDAPAEPVASAPNADVVRRPGGDAKPARKRSFGKAVSKADSDERSGWRWRDMLGGMEPIDAPADAPQASAVVRPPAGVPLTPPPAAPALPDGSDVVARLCEVKLAPSAVVDDGAIQDAAQALRSGGSAAITGALASRLHDPVVHLRGVLSADLEFKLRAESFVRSFGASLDAMPGEADVRASLGSASGRAFLLCAAALRP